MDKIQFYNPNGSTLLEVEVDDSSFKFKQIMNDNYVSIDFSFNQYIDFPSGTYIVYDGERYMCWDEPEITKINTANFQYKLQMKTYQALLSWNIFRFFTVDNVGVIDVSTIKNSGSYSGTALDWANLIVRNMNDVDDHWIVGTVIETESKLLTFDNEYCAELLNNLCSTENFDTEWEITSSYDINTGYYTKRLNICRLSYSKYNPIALSYGFGNGFRSGVKRSNADAKKIKRMFFQGGERNIDKSKYGQATLHLPKSASYIYNGITYITDSEGKYVERQGNTQKMPNSAYKNEDVYPSYTCVVSSVVPIDDVTGLYNVVCDTIPESLNFNDCMIDGEVRTMIFQTGVLGGQEFDIQNYYHTASGNNAARTFEIVPKDDAGVLLPHGTLIPKEGDTFVVFNINLPQIYIENAEHEAFIKSVESLALNEVDNFNFSGSLDQKWLRANWLSLNSRLNIGNWVNFTDNQFQSTPILIRIDSVKKYINNPYNIELSLTNTTSSGSVLSQLLNVARNEVKIKDAENSSINYSKRRWRDTQETTAMLSNMIGSLNGKFTDGVMPISVQTMQLLVGDESLQYRFVTSKTSPSVNAYDIKYKSDTKKLRFPANGIIQHMTLGISSLSSSHAVSEYKFWDMNNLSEFELGAFTDATKSYYIYAKVSTTDQTGTFIASEDPIKINDVAGYYHLLVGFLNSEYDGDRNFVTMYGFTEILPSRITTDKVISSDGKSYMDFVNNAFKLSNASGSKLFSYNVNGDGKFLFKGALVQSSSDVEFPLPCFRGAYASDVDYYKGDLVTYLGSSYICKLDSIDHAPNNATYWDIYSSAGAKGDKGDDGANAISISITGDNIYKFPKNSSTPINSTVNLTANVQGLLSPAYEWGKVVGGVYSSFGIFTQTYSPNVSILGASNSLTIRCKTNGGLQYDDYTLYKLYDGDDSITVVLSNESHTVACDKDGNPKTGEIAKAITDVNVYRGIIPLTFSETLTTNGYFTIDEFTYDGGIIDRLNNSFSLRSFNTGSNSAYCDIVVLANGVYITKRFSVTKSLDGQTGNAGTKGNYFEHQYAVNGSNTEHPPLVNTDTNPIGWNKTLPTQGLLEYTWIITAEKTYDGVLVGVWSDPVRITGVQGDKGDQGYSPSLVFRGAYSASSTYYGNSHRVDAVLYNSIYYVARVDAGTFTNITPDTTSKWNTFGAQFDSVATSLLLAENANIANFIFKNQKMVSQSETNGIPNLTLDGISGLIKMLKAEIGRFKVIDGDIIGFDTNNKEKIRLSSNLLPSADSLNQEWNILTDGFSTITNTYFYIDEGGLDDTYQNTYETSFTITQPCNVQVNSRDETEVYLSPTPHAGISILINDSVEIYFGGQLKFSGSYNQTYYAQDIGTYTVKCKTDISIDGMSGREFYDATIYQDFYAIMSQSKPEKTLIGSDGIYSIFSGGEYIYFKNGYGFETKAGNFGIQVTTSGVKKWNGSSWVAVNW